MSCAKAEIEGEFLSKCWRGRTVGSVSGGSWPHLFFFQIFVKYGWSSVKIRGAYSFLCLHKMLQVADYHAPTKLQEGNVFVSVILCRIGGSLQDWRGFLYRALALPLPLPCAGLYLPPGHVQTCSTWTSLYASLPVQFLSFPWSFLQKSYEIPVGCIPPVLYHTGGSPRQRPPCTETPVDRDPSGQRPPP